MSDKYGLDIDENLNMELSLFVLYPPLNKKDLRKTYPELNDITAFNNLSKQEMYFVYYYCSFYGTVPDNARRIKQAIYYTWGGSMGKELQEQYLKGDFPEKI